MTELERVYRQDGSGNWGWFTDVESEAGGSQPVLIDTGECMVADLLATGPKTIYTPELGDMVSVVFGDPADFEVVDPGPAAVYWGDITEDAAGNGIAKQEAGSSSADDSYSIGIPYRVRTTINPIKAFLVANDGVLGYKNIDSPALAWQANHAYSTGSWVVDGNGNFQYASVGGTSAGVEPTWETDTGLETTDNDITWNNYAAAPTAGCVRVWVQAFPQTGTLP